MRCRSTHSTAPTATSSNACLAASCRQHAPILVCRHTIHAYTHAFTILPIAFQSLCIRTPRYRKCRLVHCSQSRAFVDKCAQASCDLIQQGLSRDKQNMKATQTRFLRAALSRNAQVLLATLSSALIWSWTSFVSRFSRVWPNSFLRVGSTP